jgi:hypothetical protein
LEKKYFRSFFTIRGDPYAKKTKFIFESRYDNSGFFCLKHTYIIAEQKKLHMEGFCRGLSPQ